MPDSISVALTVFLIDECRDGNVDCDDEEDNDTTHFLFGVPCVSNPHHNGTSFHPVLISTTTMKEIENG